MQDGARWCKMVQIWKYGTSKQWGKYGGECVANSLPHTEHMESVKRPCLLRILLRFECSLQHLPQKRERVNRAVFRRPTSARFMRLRTAISNPKVLHGTARPRSSRCSDQLQSCPQCKTQEHKNIEPDILHAINRLESQSP